MSHDKTQTKITLNAKKARWLLDEVQPFIADRPLSKAHVAKLVAEMKEGHFMPEITNIMVADLNGVIYRLNGQHTATAVLKCDEDDPGFALQGVTLMTFSVDNETDLRQLYARIDRGAARTNVQVTNSILAGTPEFADVTARVLKLLPVGLSIMQFENTGERSLFAGETAAHDVQGEYFDLSKQVAAFMDSLNYRATYHGHMFRGPVVAALYATFAVDGSDAERFWRAVATGVGFESETEPAARLRQMLTNVSIQGSQPVFRGPKSQLGSEEMYRACLHAWNRYRERDSFQQALRPTVLKRRPEVQ
ncbi:MAG: hypothetical protein WDZ93_01745 [Candidatus Paceibacterota bacterium]